LVGEAYEVCVEGWFFVKNLTAHIDANSTGSVWVTLPDCQPTENTPVYFLVDQHRPMLSSHVLGILIARSWSDKHPAPLSLLVGIFSA
jgi:hypothetical protein